MSCKLGLEIAIGLSQKISLVEGSVKWSANIFQDFT